MAASAWLVLTCLKTVEAGPFLRKSMAGKLERASAAFATLGDAQNGIEELGSEGAPQCVCVTLAFHLAGFGSVRCCAAAERFSTSRRAVLLQ